jgi:hypothetical protein
MVIVGLDRQTTIRPSDARPDQVHMYVGSSYIAACLTPSVFSHAFNHENEPAYMHACAYMFNIYNNSTSPPYF